MPIDLDLFKAFGEALAIGLLVGIERYKDREPGEKKPAGIRTFAEVALLGAICQLLGGVWIPLAAFAAIVVFLVLGYRRQPKEDIGLTTELAVLLTFWLGYLVRDYELLAISAGIVLVIFLASKRSLHGFVKGQVSDPEFYDTLKFLAVVFVVLPVLPDRQLGPYDFFNPRQAWLLVIVVSAISYAGYVLMRMLGARRGLMASAVVGGVVSTTAVTVSLAERVRESAASRLFGVAAVVANAAQFPRLLVLLGFVAPILVGRLLLPFLAMLAAGLLGAWVLHRRVEGGKAFDFKLTNPFSLWPAVKFAFFIVSIFFLTQAVRDLLGEPGVYLASAIGGLASVSAASLSLADLVRTGGLAPTPAVAGCFVAIATNMAMKLVLARLHGDRRFAFWLAGGFATMLAFGVVVAIATAGG